MIIGGNHIETHRESLRTVSTYKIAGYKIRKEPMYSPKCVDYLGKSVLRVYFITLNQSPRLEWE